jgi:osmotically-inducible protein OsmY
MPMEFAPALDMADQEIQRRVVGQLAEKNRPSLRRLAVQVHQGIITLSGSVTSFYEKQLAIHSCVAVAGRGRLVDAVQVAAAG